MKQVIHDVECLQCGYRYITPIPRPCLNCGHKYLIDWGFKKEQK
jgi:DNA-directed RNA polymerase subunit RPC12/RpoP